MKSLCFFDVKKPIKFIEFIKLAISLQIGLVVFPNDLSSIFSDLYEDRSLEVEIEPSQPDSIVSSLKVTQNAENTGIFARSILIFVLKSTKSDLSSRYSLQVLKRQVFSRIQINSLSMESIAFFSSGKVTQTIAMTLLCAGSPFQMVDFLSIQDVPDESELQISHKRVDISDFPTASLTVGYDAEGKAQDIADVKDLSVRFSERLQWSDEDVEINVVIRGATAMRKDQRFASSQQHQKNFIKVPLKRSLDSTGIAPIPSNASEAEEPCSKSPKVVVDGEAGMTVNPSLPILESGWSLFEFFSGIGGMRLALPNEIQGFRVNKITAFDCSSTANEIYNENFHRNPMIGMQSSLQHILIEGLKVSDVDGKADIWTLSPPCQPYTTTRGAHQKDEKDNRSKGLFHIMSLLRQMKHGPRWMILENVKGFVGSTVLSAWKDTLSRCGYVWRQYLLSPVSSVGIPNHRLRYYMIAEHSMSVTVYRLLTPIIPEQLMQNTSVGTIVEDEVVASASSDESAAISDFVRSHGPLNLDFIATVLPADILSKFPLIPKTIGELLVSSIEHGSRDISFTTCPDLYLSPDLLQQPWASNRLSIVGDFDRRTYCFTKGYGRRFDKSTGSCYLEDSSGPLSEEQHAVDRSQLPSLHGRLRLFHPSELLLLFGFPRDFTMKDSVPLKRQFACIGNSINVEVVRAVMKALFDESVIL